MQMAGQSGAGWRASPVLWRGRPKWTPLLRGTLPKGVLIAASMTTQLKRQPSVSRTGFQ